jgi:hypothetical protein
MAESISEGTLKQWQKKVGDSVEQDEEVATIETDKVSSLCLFFSTRYVFLLQTFFGRNHRYMLQLLLNLRPQPRL